MWGILPFIGEKTEAQAAKASDSSTRRIQSQAAKTRGQNPSESPTHASPASPRSFPLPLQSGVWEGNVERIRNREGKMNPT